MRESSKVLLSALVMVLMFMANGIGGLKIAFQIRFYGCFCISGSSYYNFNVSFIENLNRTSAHTTTDDNIYTTIGKEIWQESRSMSRVSNGFTFDDLVFFDVENHKPFAMSKVLGHHSVFACYSNFHHFSFPPFVLIFLQLNSANLHRKALSCPCHMRLRFWGQSAVYR